MASKLSKKQWWFIVGAIAFVALIWFAFRYYSNPSMSEIPLYSTEERITQDAEELQGLIDSLYAESDAIAKDFISRALRDNYFSVSEEKNLASNILSQVEILSTGIKYPAIIEGLTFNLGSDKKIEVEGYKYTEERIESVLDQEFDAVGTAVKERVLLEKLNNLLSQNTQDDGWFDDKEKNIVLRLITSPEPGKRAGLKRSVALQTITRYCGKNKILVGDEPTEKKYLYELLDIYTKNDSTLVEDEKSSIMQTVTVEVPGKRLPIRRELAERWMTQYLTRF